MANTSNEGEEIQRQMAQIRRELHQDIRGVVEKAEAVADWRRYVGMYPWAALASAFVLGYLVVPSRARATTSVASQAGAAAQVEALRERIETQEKQKERTKRGLIATAWAALAPVAIRLAQGYAVQYAENWIAQQQAAAMGPVPQPRPTGASGAPTGKSVRDRGPGAY